MISKKGATNAEVEDWESLVREMIQVVQTKQLVPTMRTQYMRTAFQIPFDATVRISLDTNLCMISERGYDTQGGAKWFRDPEKPLMDNEITRFPHAVLEVKLELGGKLSVIYVVTFSIPSALQTSTLIHGIPKQLLSRGQCRASQVGD